MNQLGDLLFSLPLLAGARKTCPEMKIYSLVKKDFSNLLKATGLVDEVFIKPGNSLLKNLDIINNLKEGNFQKAVLISESPQSLFLSYLAGIKERYGFSSAGFSFLLTHKVSRSGVPSMANNRKLAEVLGLSGVPQDYTGLVKIPDYELEKADQRIVNERMNPDIIVLAPGASKRRKEKFWIKERWGEVIKFINSKDITPLLIGAPGEIQDLNDIARTSGADPKIYTSGDGLLPVAALMKRAKAFIGIDSGAMHLAASLEVPVIALFAPTDPLQVGPFPLSKNTVIKKNNMSDITPQEVIASIKFLLL